MLGHGPASVGDIELEMGEGDSNNGRGLSNVGSTILRYPTYHLTSRTNLEIKLKGRRSPL
jgi:hypothetical protein